VPRLRDGERRRRRERLDSGTESADGAAYIVAVAGVLIE
jgi:hypothetical protein